MSALLDQLLEDVLRRISQSFSIPSIASATIEPHFEARESDLIRGADSMLDFAVREKTNQKKGGAP